MNRKKVNRAGVIPYHRASEGGEIQMLFMKPSNEKYGGEKWQIAKGKQEDNESIRETALREANEELGLFNGNIERFDSIGEWLGRTTFFIACIKDKAMFGDPHFETSETKWMSLDEFMDVGRDIHKPVVKAAHRKIVKVYKDELNETYRVLRPVAFFSV